MAKLITIVTLTFLSGCYQLNWVPTSPAGNQCLNSCQFRGRQCMESPRTFVYGRQARRHCRIVEVECLSSCPDLTVRKCALGAKPLEDKDCWQMGCCDSRNECVVRNGQCVRK